RIVTRALATVWLASRTELTRSDEASYSLVSVIVLLLFSSKEAARVDDAPRSSRRQFVPPSRAFPPSKAHLAGGRATPEVMRLVLSGPSIRRKRHESVMDTVMGSGPNADPETGSLRAQESAELAQEHGRMPHLVHARVGSEGLSSKRRC